MMFSPGCGCCTSSTPTCGQVCATTTDPCASNAPLPDATVTLSRSAVSGLNLTSGGSGYTNGLNKALSFTGGGGSGATGLYDVVAGAITNPRITFGGSNYTSAPTVGFVGAGTGAGASVTASIAATVIGSCTTTGTVTSITVTNAATNGPYPTTPAVSITGGGGSGAAATANRTGGAINATITVTTGGGGYLAAPTVSFGGGTGGTVATATASMGLDTAAITTGGTGYTTGNVLTIAGGSAGTTAQLTVTAVSGGVITGVSIARAGVYSALPASPASVTGGSGAGATFTLTWKVVAVARGIAAGTLYYQPTVVFSGGGGGSGAAAAATATTINVASVTLVAGGSGYTSTPTVAIDPAAAGGVAAAVAATWAAQCCIPTTHATGQTVTYRADATKAGYTPNRATATVAGCVTANATVALADYYGATLTGCTVQNSCWGTPGSNPLSGVSVAVSQNGSPLGTFTSDSAGKVAGVEAPLNVADFPLSATASHPRFATQTVGLSACAAGAVGLIAGGVAAGYHCSNSCSLPLADTLHVTDPVYGGTVALTYSGAGVDANWSGSQLVDYPGGGPCAASAGVLVRYTLYVCDNPVAGRTQVFEVAWETPAGSTCPQAGAGFNGTARLPLSPAAAVVASCPPAFLLKLNQGDRSAMTVSQQQFYGATGLLTFTITE